MCDESAVDVKSCENFALLPDEDVLIRDFSIFPRKPRSYESNFSLSGCDRRRYIATRPVYPSLERFVNNFHKFCARGGIRVLC